MQRARIVTDASGEGGRRVVQACRSGASRGQGLKDQPENALLEYLPLVRSVARRIHARLPKHIEIEELVSAGMVGLLDALTRFDLSKKVRFESYAQFRIRGEILDSLRTLDWGSRGLRRSGRAVEETIRLLTAQLGRTPNDEEVAEGMGLELSKYQQLLGDLKGLEVGSPNFACEEDSEGDALARVPGKLEDDPHFRFSRKEVADRMASAIARLPEAERIVMMLYYFEDIKMREIAFSMGICESRVSQIHASAVMHLRAQLSDFASGQQKESCRQRILSG